MKIEITITIVTIALMAIAIHGGVFGSTKSQNFQDFKEDLKVIKANEGTEHYTPIQEDQFFVCNMWQVCQTIDADDYMSKQSLDKLWNNFDNELNTFDIEDATN